MATGCVSSASRANTVQSQASTVETSRHPQLCRKTQMNRFYGSWEVLYRTNDKKRVRYRCRCLCGKEIDVLAQNLTSGRSTQCRSCANHERAHLMHIARDLYGRLYHQARGALRRCTDTDNEDYAGRGISVYSAWKDNVQLFVEYLVTLPGFDNPELVLDRTNNDGNYEPGNLRFATWSESNFNRRTPTEKRRVI